MLHCASSNQGTNEGSLAQGAQEEEELEVLHLGRLQGRGHFCCGSEGSSDTNRE